MFHLKVGKEKSKLSPCLINQVPHHKDKEG